VIDDEEAARRSVRAHLAAAGYEVITARNGEEGVALARRHRPFAITLDVMMPGVDGWEVISRLKAAPETAHIPVVFVSVSDERATGLALGGAAFLTKPVAKEALLRELERFSTSRKVRRLLVVDDDPVVREELSSFLGERGYRVETAAGGADGLALAAVDPPDAVILDLLMPELDGFTVLERLRSAPATAHVPVVILTAKDLTAEERLRLNASANRIVTKGKAGSVSVWEELDRSLKLLSAAGDHRARGERPRVLVVEDNPVAALQIRTALEENGYQVDTAAGGREGVERVRAALPDAIVLDLMMPEVDGFQVLEEVRSTPESATLPVLVLTAKELTGADRARLSHNHVQELVQKGSLDREQLVRRVDRMVGRGPAAAASTPEARKPRAAAGPPGPAPVTQVRPAAIAGSGGVVLVVEDNRDNRYTISALLEDLGLDYRTVGGGEESIQAARQLRPSLILMDVQLPGLSGVEAMRRLKADPELQRIPVVALTAKAMKGDREAMLAAGYDDYIAKPIENASFAEVVRKWVG
jgi:CheY-like chemotaxis protein